MVCMYQQGMDNETLSMYCSHCYCAVMYALIRQSIGDSHPVLKTYVSVYRYNTINTPAYHVVPTIWLETEDETKICLYTSTWPTWLSLPYFVTWVGGRSNVYGASVFDPHVQ